MRRKYAAFAYTYVYASTVNLSTTVGNAAGLTAALRYTAEFKELSVAFFKHD